MNKPKKIKWTDDAENSDIIPDDGEMGFIYWWEDMRPKEVRRLVQEAYKRGVVRGWNECCDRVNDASFEHDIDGGGYHSYRCEVCEILSEFRRTTNQDIECVERDRDIEEEG